MPFCKNCGAEVKEEAKFCPKCGTPRKKIAREGDKIPKLSEDKKIIAIAVIVGICVLGIVGYFVLNQPQTEQESNNLAISTTSTIHKMVKSTSLPETTISTSLPTTSIRVTTTSIKPKETCYDGIQNQGEDAIDCGGPCRSCKPEDCDERCMGILNFNWNAEGNDCYNLNDEYVVFRNSCSYPCDLTGWSVKDEGNNIYTFPRFTLGEEATVTLYTGCGTNTETELYWCSSGRECNAIWNNNGDTLYLRDINGKLIIDYSYEGFKDYT